MKALAAGLIMGLALTACSPGHECPTQPTPRADLLTLSSEDGSTLHTREVPYGPFAVRGGELFGTDASAPLARVDSSPTPSAAPVHNDDRDNALVRGGSRPWRFAGAAGTYVTTTPERVVVVLGHDRQLRGVRLDDGRPLWNVRLDHRLVTDGVHAHDGALFAHGFRFDSGEATTDGQVFALDQSTGRPRWIRRVGDNGLRQRTMAVRGDRVFVGISAGTQSGRAQLSALNAATGEVRWQVALPRGAIISVYLSGGQLVTVNQDVVLGCD